MLSRHAQPDILAVEAPRLAFRPRRGRTDRARSHECPVPQPLTRASSLVIDPLKASKGMHMVPFTVKAPTFVLPRDGAATWPCRDFTGLKLVLFFYPKHRTPGARRKRAFSALKGDFANAETNRRDFGDREVPRTSSGTSRLKVALGSTKARNAAALWVWGEKSMYGAIMGVRRTPFLITAMGACAGLGEVKGRHAEAVLEPHGSVGTRLRHDSSCARRFATRARIICDPLTDGPIPLGKLTM